MKKVCILQESLCIKAEQCLGQQKSSETAQSKRESTPPTQSTEGNILDKATSTPEGKKEGGGNNDAVFH